MMNAFVVAFLDDGSPVQLLVRGTGEVVLMQEIPPGRALSLDGISFPAG